MLLLERNIVLKKKKHFFNEENPLMTTVHGIKYIYLIGYSSRHPHFCEHFINMILYEKEDLIQIDFAVDFMDLVFSIL